MSDNEENLMIGALLGMATGDTASTSFDDFLAGLGNSHSTPKNADVEEDELPLSDISTATRSETTSHDNGIWTCTSGRGERRPTNLPSWRSHSTGLLYLMVEKMMEVGTPSLAHRDVERLHQSVPPLGIERDVIPVMLLSIYTLTRTPNAREVLQTWNQRLGVVAVTRPETTTRRSGAPPSQDQPLPWNYDIWCLAVQVILRFTHQNLPATEMEFLGSIGDILREAAMNAWAVEVIVLSLYFIWRTNWAWDVLFNN